MNGEILYYALLNEINKMKTFGNYCRCSPLLQQRKLHSFNGELHFNLLIISFLCCRWTMGIGGFLDVGFLGG
jgi:hypothetical protein